MSRRAGRLWPVALVGLLAGSAAVNLAFVLIAVRDPSFAVERDYYRKAVAWDRAAAQERRNGDLGWVAQASLAPDAGGQARLEVRLRDAGGRPVEGARVAVETFHSARAGHVVAALLTPDAPGHYRTTLPAARHGLWEVRLSAERDGQRFTAVLTPELGITR